MRILVFGTFDRLHPGHRFLLDTAASKGDLHVVVARDINVLRFKERRAEQSQDDRVNAIKKSYPDATVILGDPHDFLAPLRVMKPDLIFLGYDQHLPPGVTEKDLPCPTQRVASFHPEKYKSSLLRKDLKDGKE